MGGLHSQNVKKISHINHMNVRDIPQNFTTEKPKVVFTLKVLTFHELCRFWFGKICAMETKEGYGIIKYQLGRLVLT